MGGSATGRKLTSEYPVQLLVSIGYSYPYSLNRSRHQMVVTKDSPGRENEGSISTFERQRNENVEG